MILFNKGFFKVWKVDKKEKYTNLNCSTSDKQQDGTYKNSNWNVKLVGKANDLIVAEKDTLIVKNAKVENIWDKEKERNWLNVIVFDAEVQGQAPNNDEPVESSESDLPF